MRRQIEHIGPPPAFAMTGGEGEIVAVALDAIEGPSGLLFQVGHKAQGSIEQMGAKTDVGQVGALGQVDKQ